MWASVDIIKFFKPTTGEEFDLPVLPTAHKSVKMNDLRIIYNLFYRHKIAILGMNDSDLEMSESGNAFAHRLIIPISIIPYVK